MGLTREQKVIRQVVGKPQVQPFTPVATDMFLPNHSGISSHPEFIKNMNIPSGVICLWYGALLAIPSGWWPCDGTNGTPNLLDKFVLGAGVTYSPGDTGGEETHTLTTDEIPAHAHTMTQKVSGISGTSAQLNTAVVCSVTTTASTSSVGGDGAHNNMPPYHALYYIMKL